MGGGAHRNMQQTWVVSKHTNMSDKMLERLRMADHLRLKSSIAIECSSSSDRQLILKRFHLSDGQPYTVKQK